MGGGGLKYELKNKTNLKQSWVGVKAERVKKNLRLSAFCILQSVMYVCYLNVFLIKKYVV